MRSIVDEWVVVGIGSTARPNRFMMLNDSAARLWELLQKGAEEEELTEALIGEYGVDCETARADADAFIRRLLESGIAEAY